MAKSTMNVLRMIDVLNAAKKLVGVYQEWNSQDGPQVNWNGEVTKAISEQLHREIETACDLTADAGMEVEASGKAIVLVFDDIARYFLKWIQDASMQLQTAPPRGSSELLNSLDRLVDQIKV